MADDGFSITLTDKGRAEADRRDPDGTITLLREAREIYIGGKAEDWKRADANVILVYARGRELDDVEMVRAAVNLARGEGANHAR